MQTFFQILFGFISLILAAKILYSGLSCVLFNKANKSNDLVKTSSW